MKTNLSETAVAEISNAATKHTPGPWKYSRSTKTASILGIWVADVDSRDFLVAADVRGMSEDECSSNASLIAAAPELLERLKEMVKDVIDHASLGLNTREVGMLQRAEAAIARATRGQSRRDTL